MNNRKRFYNQFIENGFILCHIFVVSFICLNFLNMFILVIIVHTFLSTMLMKMCWSLIVSVKFGCVSEVWLCPRNVVVGEVWECLNDLSCIEFLHIYASYHLMCESLSKVPKSWSYCCLFDLTVYEGLVIGL